MAEVSAAIVIGKAWQRQCDEAWDLLAKHVNAERAVLMKGLLREYATATARGDQDSMSRISKAFSQEQWSVNGATVQREVGRDAKGRFTRKLVNDRPTSRLMDRPQQGVGQRAKGHVLVDQNALKMQDPNNAYQQAQQIGNQVALGQTGQAQTAAGLAHGMQGLPQQEALQRQLSMDEVDQRAQGLVRGVAAFQDELADLFGDSINDVQLVVRPTFEGAPEQPLVQGANAPIGQDPRVLQTLYDAAEKAPVGQEAVELGFQAAPGSIAEQRVQNFNAMSRFGMPPERAASMVANNMQASAPPDPAMLTAFNNYQENSQNTGGIRRGFDALTQLGQGMMQSSFLPAEARAAGFMINRAGQYGNMVPEQVWTAGEKARHRYQGRKREVPGSFQQLMDTPVMQDVRLMQTDKGFGVEQWSQWAAAAGDEADRVTARWLQETSGRPNRRAPVDARWAPLVSTHLNDPSIRNPRAFSDVVQRDGAVASLVPMIPADSNTVDVLGRGKAPSQGMIIPARGQATQSYTGVGADSYTPFSALALRKLHNGQYVRTREVGGLTSEDIRTLMAAKGKSATVVSSSGVFTITMKPGMSRKSPEVLAMAERYDQILNRIVTEDLYSKDISSAARRQVEDSLISRGLTRGSDAWNTARDAEIARLRREAERIDPTRQQELEAEAEKQVTPGLSPQAAARQKADILNELTQQEIGEQVKRIKLDHDGYLLALQALQQQYPDVIQSVKAEKLRGWVESRNLTPWLGGAGLALRNRANSEDKATRDRLAQGGKKAKTEAPASSGGSSASGGGTTTTTATGGAPRAAGGGGTGGGGGSGGGSQQSTVPLPAVGPVAGLAGMRQQGGLKRVLQKLQREQADNGAAVWFPGVTPPVIEVEPGVKADFNGKADFEQVVNPSDAIGLPGRVKDDPSKLPQVIVQSSDMLSAAAKSPEGLTLAMQLAFNPAALNRVKDDSGKALSRDAKEDFAQFAEAVTSGALLADARMIGQNDNPDPLAFMVGDGLAQVASNQLAQGPSKAAADAVMNYTYSNSGDVSGVKQAESALWGLLAADGDPNRTGNYGLPRVTGKEPISASEPEMRPSDALSTMGLLAAQSVVFDAIDNMSWDEKDEPAAKAIMSVMGSGVWNDQASLENSKQQAKRKWALMFGANYMRQLTGGDPAVPKALAGDDPAMLKAAQGVMLEKSLEEEPDQMLPLPPLVPMTRRLLGV